MDPRSAPPPAPSAGSSTGAQAAADEAAFREKVERLPTYREHLEELKTRLAESGFLALLLIDVSDINKIERDYGSDVYDDLMKLVREVVFELKGKQLRTGDVVALNERAGDVFLIFLRPRNAQELLLAEDLEKIGNRIESFLTRKISKTALHYLQERREITVGTSLALRNPLIREERLILRAIEEARQAAHFNRQRRHLANKQLLQRIILKEQIDTVFQPIFDLRSGKYRSSTSRPRRICCSSSITSADARRCRPVATWNGNTSSSSTPCPFRCAIRASRESTSSIFSRERIWPPSKSSSR
jgi:GGDEF domain-containing protein